MSAYLDLMEQCLMGAVYEEVDKAGKTWPKFAHTMVGQARLRNVRDCVITALHEKVPGDLIEAGVWRGGCTILMRAVLKDFGVADRNVWVADSFEGLPRPNSINYPADKGLDLSIYPELAVGMWQVKANFQRYGLLDEQVKFLKGWFKNTLPTAPINSLAVLRADGDLYESTHDIFTHLYPKLESGGFVIVDDYNDIPQCKQAVTDYRAKHGITTPIIDIDHTGVYWRKD